MNTFSIADLQQFSGIKAHTIRMWEQRYNALQPNRSEGNTRFYSNDQLRRLLNITSLLSTNHKVSELCLMQDQELYKLIDDQVAEHSTEQHLDPFISQMVAAGVVYDEIGFERLFSTCLLRFGMGKTYRNIIYPLLDRLGLMWVKDAIPPAQEHFITNIIKQKMYAAIDGLPVPKSQLNTWLLFLPENEFHEIGLLFANYLIRASGKKVVYLGANIPLESLNESVKILNPSHLLFFLVHNDIVEKSQQYINKLHDYFSDKNIMLSGNKKLLSKLDLEKNIRWLQSIEDLESVIAA